MRSNRMGNNSIPGIESADYAPEKGLDIGMWFLSVASISFHSILSLE